MIVNFRLRTDYKPRSRVDTVDSFLFARNAPHNVAINSCGRYIVAHQETTSRANAHDQESAPCNIVSP